MFKHKLGIEVKQRTTGFRGLLISRSENLFGCNRYFVQPKADKDMKIPESWWCDEGDLEKIGDGIQVDNSPDVKPGGPMSKKR